MSSIPALLSSIVTLLSPSAMHQDFISCGFQPNSPFASTNGTFAVLDPAEASAVDRRVMMVAVFPDEATAKTARERGTHLFAGYGPAVWRGDVALSQSSTLLLSHLEIVVSQTGETVGNAEGIANLERYLAARETAVDADFVACLDQALAPEAE